MMLDLETDDEVDDEAEIDQAEIEKSAEMLYGIFHSSFILTDIGISQMVEKFQRGDFGMCRRFHCRSELLLPIGKFFCVFSCTLVTTTKNDFRVGRYFLGNFLSWKLFT